MRISKVSLWLLAALMFGVTAASARDESEPEALAIRTAAQKAMAADDFDGLQSQIDEYRRKDIHVRGGMPAVSLFYKAFEPANDADFQFLSGFAQRWIAARPNTPTAHLAFARLWSAYAWLARGDGYAKDIAPARMDLFEQRIAEAAKQFDLVDKSYADPYFYSMATRLGRDMYGSRGLLDTIYERSIAAFPDYYPTPETRVELLEPKWFGKPRESVDYVRSLPMAIEQPYGRIAYAWTVESMACCESSPAMFEPQNFSWPQLKDAYALKDKTYGSTRFDWNAMLKLAMMAGDKETGRTMFDKLAHHIDTTLWPRGDAALAYRWVTTP